MKTTADFITWLCRFYEFNGKSPYNKTQVDEITEWVSLYVRTENGRLQLKNELRRNYDTRPLMKNIAETWDRINIDEPETIGMISEGNAFDIFKRLSAIREKQTNGYIPTPSEADYLARWSKLEYIMGELLDDGRSDEAMKVGEYIKGALEQGKKIPVINIDGKKDLLAYLDKVVRSINIGEGRKAS